MESGIPALDFSFGFDDANFSDRTIFLEINSGKKYRLNVTTAPQVRVVHINSLILAARSSFFRILFSNGMRESEQKHATLRIDASEEVSFMDLLKYVYSNNLPTTFDALLDLVVTADKFEVDSCVRACTESLQNLPMTCESASVYLDLSSSLVTIQPLIDAAKKFLVALYKELDKFKDEVLNLSLASIEAVLSSDDLVVTSEYVVYDLVRRWALKHYPGVEERREILKTHLLSLVRFPFLTTTELIEEVQTCIDIDPEIASKIAFHALCFKTGTPHQKNCLIAEEGTAASRQFVKRAYKQKPVKMLEFVLPHQHCLVYFDITREELTNIYPEGQIRSETFYLGDLELYLVVSCSIDTGLHYFGLSLAKKGSTRNTYEYKTTFRKKPSNDFERLGQGIEKPETMNRAMSGIKWNNFIGDDSNFFIDDIFHLRVELTLIK